MGKKVNIILRIILAAIFIFSGVGKLISLESFETYVWGLDALPMGLSIFSARLLIGIELIIGILLLANLIPGITWLFTTILIIGFTVFLFIQVITGVEENCNCFGNVLQLSPLASFIKNIIILGLLFWLKKYLNAVTCKMRIGYVVPLIVLGLIVPFILNPAINLLFKHKEYSLAELTQQSKIIEDKFAPNRDFNIYEGKKVVCLYSLKCVYCIKGAEKLSQLADQQGFNENVLVFFVGNEENVEWFYNASNSNRFNYRMMSKKELKIITSGKVPRIFLVNDGIVKQTLRYNDITESKFLKFFFSK